MVDYLGQQLGNYRLSKLLGRGGFADVYLGEHIYLNTPAAIKVVQVRLFADALEQFLSEARTIAHLSHPNIIPVLEFGMEQETPFLVMAYAPYGSLRQRHPSGTRLPMNTIVTYVRQVAAALQYAHDRKVIHRDVKPENMLLGQDERVILSDFGIAISAQTIQNAPAPSAQPPGLIVGTTTYMAPEQFQGQPLLASDQYALGIVVYEWFCGAPPFSGLAIEVALQHLQAVPLLLREKVPGLPASVEQVVMRAIAKDPQSRFPSIQAFAHALEEAAQAATVHASTPTVFSVPPLALPTAATSSGSHPSRGLLSTAKSTLPTNKPLTPVLPAQPAQPQLPTQLPRFPISRRKLIIGLAGLTVIGASIFAAETIQHNLSQRPTGTTPTKTAPVASPTPTPSPTPDLNATPRAIINATTTRPALTTSGSGTLDLFIRGSDNALWHRSFNGAWQSWESLGGILSYDPVATSWGPGRFDVFVRGSDNALQHKWFDGTWHDWESLSGVITADPAAVSWAPGRVDVFVRGMFGDLWHKAFDGIWHDWEAQGGSFASDPTVASNTPGHLDIFVRGSFNDLQHKAFDGTWHNWEGLPGIFTSDPCVISWGNGRLDVFVRGTDNTLKHKWFDGVWYDWESLGGTLASSPTAVTWGVGRMDVFARGIDNTLQHIWYDGTWHPWETFQ